jgi:hypothetical protein
MYSSTISLISVVDGGGWLKPRSDRFFPEKETRYPLYRKICGPQGHSGRVQKIRSPDRPAPSESPC